MTTHTVPGRGKHEGEEWDCGPCREALLEAFRPAADAPVGPPAPEAPSAPSPAPQGPSRQMTEQEWLDGDGTAVQHLAGASVTPAEDAPGGTWKAECSCGWSKSGHYARDGFGSTVAARLAGKYAELHMKDPEAEL